MSNASQDNQQDHSFYPQSEHLIKGLELLLSTAENQIPQNFSADLPEKGMSELVVLQTLAPHVLSGAADLRGTHSFAHMDPPTPWISWITTLWNASLNQNLLHSDLSPVATEIELVLMKWLAPYFGMNGGHMTPGSTVSNLTALWAARELKGVKRVIASNAAHLSIAKSAHLLGLEFVAIETDEHGKINLSLLPDDLGDAALVLTAGTTNAGAIDNLRLLQKAAWLHVDAAWAGPLVFTAKYKDRLLGIELADSVSVSAHKWLFQPKEAGLVLFKDTALAHSAVSFGGAYLASPNIGVLGSRGAVAIPLFATLLSWGKQGLASRIDKCMEMSERLRTNLNRHPEIAIFGPNTSGVILWRPTNHLTVEQIFDYLPDGSVSKTRMNNISWLRHVAANPNANVDSLWNYIEEAISR
jgi:L-2,4-diaminobutyrate decarboxylase